MNYRADKYGNKISILGYGCMRFPRKLGQVDTVETERQMMAAYEAGVNYFDTAYVYGSSEAVVGEILEKNGIREKVYIATKLPHYLVRKPEDIERIFTEQLERLRTDHIDYYLIHMLSDIGAWEKLCSFGILEWIAEKKASGAIGQIGFSYHGNSEMFCRLIDAYDWEFCQIQYNYMDEHSQAGRRGLNYAAERGLPVVIMEPLRGGKLVSHLPDTAKQIFARYPVEHTPAQWAFRWLWNQPQVTCVLSGMNTMDTVLDNIETASTVEVGELGEAEEAMLREVAAAINANMKVGCTGCGYCMPCPKNVDIPGTFAAYNRRFAEGKLWGLVDYAMCTAMRQTSTAASNCVGCGKCESHCPQQIPIRAALKDAADAFEGPLYRTARWVVEKFKLF